MSVYRTHAELLARLEKLELLRTQVELFVKAERTEPGWPERKYAAMREALEALNDTHDPSSPRSATSSEG